MLMLVKDEEYTWLSIESLYVACKRINGIERLSLFTTSNYGTIRGSSSSISDHHSSALQRSATRRLIKDIKFRCEFVPFCFSRKLSRPSLRLVYCFPCRLDV